MTGGDANVRDESSGDALTTVIGDGRIAHEGDEERALEAVKAGLFGASRRAVVLSRYVLLSRIGSGGLGIVFAAYDPDLDRKVAVKLLRALAGEGSESGRTRLVREAQAMARLAHPNVIAVHDVGVYEEELPPGPGIEREGVFVVMELVDGVELNAWRNQSARSWREIVRVFSDAGRGLAAAHEAGLVHRDFKPSNVLVGRDGRVRVLDFGLARAAGDEDPAAQGRPRVSTPGRTPPQLARPLTETGNLLGTPAYMAPEQHTGSRADERSDQFSFCVALYEALYGARPFTGRVLHDLALQKHSGEIADPPGKSRVPGRIDAAVRRGLSPKPGDRYPTMDALLADLRVRRASGRWVTVGLLGTAIGGVGASFAIASVEEDPCPPASSRLAGVWDDQTRAEAEQAFVATQAPFAASAWRSVAEGLDAYAATWVRLRHEVCMTTLVHEREPEEAMRRREACLDRGVARLGELVQVFAEADAAVVERAVTAVEELPPLQRCVEGAPPGDVGSEAAPGQLGRVERALARATASMVAGRLKEAGHAIKEAEAAAREPEHAPSLARVLNVRGQLERRLGDTDRAGVTLMEALAHAERSGDQRNATLILAWLANTRLDQSRAADGGELLHLARAKLARHRLDARVELRILQAEGTIADHDGRFEDALAIGRQTLDRAKEVYGDNHGLVSHAHGRIGAAYSHLGRPADAQEHYVVALELSEERLGTDHPDVAEALGNVASVLSVLGDRKEATALHARAVELLERAYGEAHPRYARALVNYANSLIDDNRPDAALQAMERAIALFDGSGRAEHPDTAFAMVNVSLLLREKGRSEEALKTIESALPILEASLGARHPRTAVGFVNRGQILADLGRVDEGLADLSLARAVWTETLGEDHPWVALSLKAAAEIELGRNRTDVAIELLRSAIGKLERVEAEPRELALARLLLARTLNPRQPKRAQELATRAVEAYIASGGDLAVLRGAAPWGEELGFIPPAG